MLANGDSANVAIYAVALAPEPSSLALIVLGCLGLGGLAIANRYPRWRRRSASNEAGRNAGIVEMKYGGPPHAAD